MRRVMSYTSAGRSVSEAFARPGFFLRATLLSGGLVLASVLGAGMSASQTTATSNSPANGGNRQPVEAARAVLELFDTYQVVGMNSAHRMKDLDDFILSLIRNPAFPSVVDDVVVECGNSLYQETLDRYIAGEDVPLSDARQVWRNTTQPMCGVSAFYEQLFPLIRRINERLPPGLRLRVVAGDPPIDWNAVKTESEVKAFLSNRDATIATVMESEVLAKRRKALMLFGIGHLTHAPNINAASAGLKIPETAVARYEKRYPGVTFVIDQYSGAGCGSAGSSSTIPAVAAFEARLPSMAVPSLVFAKETGVATFGRIDGYLYLGPRDLVLAELRPASVFVDQTFMAELNRRAALMAAGLNNQIEPDYVREQDSSPFLYCR